MIYIYVRMSVVRQKCTSGLSEESQIRVCSGYAGSLMDEEGQLIPMGKACYPVDAPPGMFIDRGVSGTTSINERPAGIALLNVLKPGDHVVFYNVERAFRSVLYYCETLKVWLKNGIIPHFVQQQFNFSTATGTMMGHILASLAQYYSDLIRQRTREAKAINSVLNVKKVGKEPSAKWQNSSIVLHTKKLKESAIKPGVVRIYNRVSHIDQAISGLSMEVQRDRNVKFAQWLASENPSLSIHPEPYEDESVSAFKVNFEDRPAGKRILDDCGPGDQVVVYRNDRAFRHPAQAVKLSEVLAKKGAVLHLVDERISTNTEMGKTWITMLSCFAKIESEIKSERNKEISENQRANGRPCNQKVPYYCTVKEYSIDGQIVRKLIYDKKKFTELGMVLVMKHIGYSWSQISGFMDILSGNGCRYKAVRGKSKVEYRTAGGWHMSVKRRVKDFKLVMDKIPPVVIRQTYEEGWNALYDAEVTAGPVKSKDLLAVMKTLRMQDVVQAMMEGKPSLKLIKPFRFSDLS